MGPDPGGTPPLGPEAQRTLEGVYGAHARAQRHLWWGLGGAVLAVLLLPLPLLFPHAPGTATVFSRAGMVLGAGVMAFNGVRCIRAYRQMNRIGRQGLGG